MEELAGTLGLEVSFFQSNAEGDLVDAIPYAGHGYPREWLAALKDIRLLGARTYLPGHGATSS